MAKRVAFVTGRPVADHIATFRHDGVLHDGGPSGGGGSPAGSDGNIQIKDGSAFGAITGSSWDGTNLGLPDGAVAAPIYAFTADRALGLFRDTANTSGSLGFAGIASAGTVRAPVGTFPITLGDPGSVDNGDHEVYITAVSPSAVETTAIGPFAVTIANNEQILGLQASWHPLGVAFYRVYVTKSGETGVSNSHLSLDNWTNQSATTICNMDDATLDGQPAPPVGATITTSGLVVRNGMLQADDNEYQGYFGDWFTLLRTNLEGGYPIAQIGDENNTGVYSFGSSAFYATGNKDLGILELPFNSLHLASNITFGGYGAITLSDGLDLSVTSTSPPNAQTLLRIQPDTATTLYLGGTDVPFYLYSGSYATNEVQRLAFWWNIGGEGSHAEVFGSELTDDPSYFLWYDGKIANGSAVWRVNERGVMAYYNPGFSSDYTPGAANFERIVQQWNSNVAEIGNEKGGTGTLRNLRLIGGGLEFGSSLVAPAGSGTRYLCISTTGVVTSSATACSGT